jgi:hypothetical protein
MTFISSFKYHISSLMAPPHTYHAYMYICIAPFCYYKVADAWVDMLHMKGSFMNSLYRDDSTIDGKIEVVWYSWILNLSIFGDTLASDMAMVVFSVLFVWIWMNLHVDSFFIANVGMFQIFMSLPFGRFFYSIIGQVKFFTVLQVLLLYSCLVVCCLK